MSRAWASCYTVAILWNGGFILFLACEIARTGNIQIEASTSHAMTTADALVLLICLGCSLACALHHLCPRRAGRNEA